MITRADWFLAGVFCASALWAQTSEPQAADLDQTVASALAVTGAPSASVAVVRGGQIAYAKAFGKADLETDRPADTSTRYAVGSISKQFTVAALAVALAETFTGVLGGAAAGGSGFTCQIAPAPLMLPCVQSAPT